MDLVGITSRSVTHPQITPDPTCLTWRLFEDELLEKKKNLVGMSIYQSNQALSQEVTIYDA
jgi:hypothetical protein